MRTRFELEPSTRQLFEEGFSAASGRLALPMFDLGFLQHDLMGMAKKLIYTEADLLPPPGTASALAPLTQEQQQRYHAFCDAAFAALLTAGEVVTSLGAFAVSQNTGAAAKPISQGVHPFWETRHLLVAVDPDFARACRCEYQPRFMSRFPEAL